MKVSDIPTEPILEYLSTFEEWQWCYWMPGERSIQNAMPPDLDTNLVLAKMRKLIKRGLVDGCDCGCRGDYVITDKGREYIRQGEAKE